MLGFGKLACDVTTFTFEGGRVVNEDYLRVEKRQQDVIALLADGLGGQGSGDIASRTAVDGALETLEQCGRITPAALKAAFEEANARVHAGRTRLSNKMLSTLNAAVVTHSWAYLAHVGDSRTYCMRAGRVLFRTVDHSVSQLMVDSGELTDAEVRGHASRNLLYRAVGEEGALEVAGTRLRLHRGDRLLLCSDGFWELLSDAEMAETSLAPDADAWMERMKALALARMRADSDNMSAITLAVH